MKPLQQKFAGVMLALDTNVIVRFLTGDDPAQAKRARNLINTRQVFIGTTVLLETEWVLRNAYGFSATRIVAALRALAGLPHATLEDARLVATACDLAEGGMDFADALHIASAKDCDGFVTFDEACVKSAKGQRGISVRKL
jgi:predicted nucleic-acid-binding protein